MPAPRAMVCQEVAGGNTSFEGGLALPGLEAWVISRPYNGQSGGGDVHYLSSCATGRITRLLIADVSGHGQRVAQTSAALRDLMRKHANYVDQSRVVRTMNTEFGAVADGRFATAIVATFWEPTAQLILCNAGHPRPFKRRARDGAWSTLSLNPDDQAHHADDIRNLPLGIEELTRYEQLATHLAPGDAVLLYTDALVEAMSPARTQLGEAGLRALLHERALDDPTLFLRTLLADVTAFSGGPLADDATAMLIRRTDTRPAFWSGLAAPIRIGSAALASLAGGRGPIPWPERRLDNILGPFLPFLNRRKP